MDFQSESAAIYVLVSKSTFAPFCSYIAELIVAPATSGSKSFQFQVVASLYLVMVVIMVATNYKMKERTRRPPRAEREQEEKREEEVEHLINSFHHIISIINSAQEVDSSVTMEGREINARLPRGVVEV